MNAEDLTGVELRHATSADADGLSEFAARTFQQAFAAENSKQHMREHIEKTFRPELQAREIADDAVRTILAFANEKLVGYAQVRSSQPPPCVHVESPIELHRIYVDNSAHGRGVAQGLMESVLDTARERRATHVWLGVWERNPRAIRFYEKFGFQDVGSQSFYLGTDCQTDRVLMTELAE